MLVAEAETHFQFVTQPAHAHLAGQFADRWGGDGFAPLDPEGPVVAATYNHDDGWWAYDRQPHLDSQGRPLSFRDVDAETWTAIYEQGADTVEAVDPYAGLLVALHGAGLQQQRYGLAPDWQPLQPAYADYVAGEERRQSRLAETLAEEGRIAALGRELLADLHGSGSPSPDTAESRLWRNYRLLQAWDTLSLSLCTTTDPPSYPEIDAVPRGDGEDAVLSVTPVEDGFRVDPYPFETSPLAVQVPARTVPKDAFETEEELTRAYYRADRETRTFRLRRASG